MDIFFSRLIKIIFIYVLIVRTTENVQTFMTHTFYYFLVSQEYLCHKFSCCFVIYKKIFFEEGFRTKMFVHGTNTDKVYFIMNSL